jgi:hypothetical protein
MVIAMSSSILTDLKNRAGNLTKDEQLELMAYLIEQMRNDKKSEQRYDWRELEGILPYPALGEDAQEWISRTRREDDERRQQQLPPEYRV